MVSALLVSAGPTALATSTRSDTRLYLHRSVPPDGVFEAAMSGAILVPTKKPLRTDDLCCCRL